MHTERPITGFGALQLSDSKLRSHNFVDARASRNKDSATTNAHYSTYALPAYVFVPIRLMACSSASPCNLAVIIGTASVTNDALFPNHPRAEAIILMERMSLED
ncbi:hypothetical protein Pdw03_4916 [Penicillium digitatum]|uniref:Uncharacterized protein n=1 Tax=Penicillium digitatum TaxID=36651 RepID=A0A7T6XJ65_PENDI|nr:hypothetical protein PDIDSM_5965 [Penicillium digitatum]QQK42062.1 hypothetical protein Pdw03_4916 [Penicillium digitatum]